MPYIFDDADKKRLKKIEPILDKNLILHSVDDYFKKFRLTMCDRCLNIDTHSMVYCNRCGGKYKRLISNVEPSITNRRWVNSATSDQDKSLRVRRLYGNFKKGLIK